MHKQFPDIPLPHLIVSVCGKLRSYRLARNLDDNSIPEPIFWLPNKPPDGWNVDTLSEFYRDMFLGWNRKMLRKVWAELICPITVIFLICGVWLFAMACPFVVIVRCSIGGQFCIALGFLCFVLVAVLSLPIINRLICWWDRKFLS